MDVVILTGISGAGKSQAAAFFEDQGYFCIDNVPPQFLTELTEVFLRDEVSESPQYFFILLKK